MEFYSFDKLILEKNEDGTYNLYSESPVFDSMNEKRYASKVTSKRCVPTISIDFLIDNEGNMISIRV
jgi:hypothetical protein